MKILASSALLIPEALNFPEATMAVCVAEGSFMLKLTKGMGWRVTVLKEETSRPVGGDEGGLERITVKECGTRRMRERTVDWRGEDRA